MSDKNSKTVNTPSVDDLIEKSIADAKKVRQVALKSAEKSLKEKYSKDLKQFYLNNLNEDYDVDLDLEPDIQHLDEEMVMKDEEDPFAQEPGQDEDPSAGLGGPDAGGLGGAEPGANELGPSGPDVDAMSQAGGGEAPDPNTLGNSMDQIPYDHEGVDDPAAVLAKIKELVSGNQDPNEDVELSLDFDAQSQDGMQDLGEEVPQFGAPEEDQNLFRPESLQLNDDVLLDYIEKSLRNDKIIDQLKEDLDILSVQVTELQEALSVSNNNLKELSQQNVRLIYQNKVLNDDSLSEHQKKYIVKALDKAETLKEAKTIYETAKVVPAKKQVNQSVVDSLGTRATATVNVMRENKQPEMLEQAARWQELAGIKRR